MLVVTLFVLSGSTNGLFFPCEGLWIIFFACTQFSSGFCTSFSYRLAKICITWIRKKTNVPKERLSIHFTSRGLSYVNFDHFDSLFRSMYQQWKYTEIHHEEKRWQQGFKRSKKESSICWHQWRVRKNGGTSIHTWSVCLLCLLPTWVIFKGT